jgi:hypothetical protein
MLTRVAFVIVAGVILSICAALPWTLHWQGPGLCDDGVPYSGLEGHISYILVWKSLILEGLCCSIWTRLQKYGEYFP